MADFVAEVGGLSADLARSGGASRFFSACEPYLMLAE
jgi:hypothetical protein